MLTIASSEEEKLREKHGRDQRHERRAEPHDCQHLRILAHQALGEGERCASDEYVSLSDLRRPG